MIDDGGYGHNNTDLMNIIGTSRLKGYSHFSTNKEAL